jgi:hypothetical protein
MMMITLNGKEQTQTDGHNIHKYTDSISNHNNNTNKKGIAMINKIIIVTIRRIKPIA